MENKEENNVENIQEKIDLVKKNTEEIINLEQVKDLIKSNTYEFDYDGVTYKISKPTFKDKYEVSRQQSKRYIEMLKDPQYMLEKDLIEIYESRGISIKELDEKFENLKKEKEELSKKLGKALEDKLSENDVEVIAKEVVKVEEEQRSVVMKKSVLLNDSLESQLAVFSYTYLAFILTQKKEGEVFIKAFKTYEDFVNSEEKLVNILIWYTMFMGKDEITPLNSL